MARPCPGCNCHKVVTTKIVYQATMKKQGEFIQFTVPELPIDECRCCKEQWMTKKSYKVLREILKKK
jgi:hypothetical protein